jgi:hypothetical protein
MRTHGREKADFPAAEIRAIAEARRQFNERVAAFNARSAAKKAAEAAA